MHEMSIAQNLVTLIREEMKKHSATRLIRVRVRHGVLAGVVPEALSMAFEVMTVDTDLEGAVLETIEEPLKLACGSCKNEFTSESTSPFYFEACPKCGEEFGHKVLSGKEMYLDQLEIE